MIFSAKNRTSSACFGKVMLKNRGVVFLETRCRMSPMHFIYVDFYRFIIDLLRRENILRDLRD